MLKDIKHLFLCTFSAVLFLGLQRWLFRLGAGDTRGWGITVRSVCQRSDGRCLHGLGLCVWRVPLAMRSGLLPCCWHVHTVPDWDICTVFRSAR